MRKLPFDLGITAAASSIMTGTAAQADANVTTLSFAVTRNGEQIGSTTFRLQQRGD